MLQSAVQMLLALSSELLMPGSFWHMPYALRFLCGESMQDPNASPRRLHHFCGVRHLARQLLKNLYAHLCWPSVHSHGRSLYRALVWLITASPCAPGSKWQMKLSAGGRKHQLRDAQRLILSTPLVYVSGLSVAAANGARAASSLEASEFSSCNSGKNLRCVLSCTFD